MTLREWLRAAQVACPHLDELCRTLDPEALLSNS